MALDVAKHLVGHVVTDAQAVGEPLTNLGRGQFDDGGFD